MKKTFGDVDIKIFDDSKNNLIKREKIRFNNFEDIGNAEKNYKKEKDDKDKNDKEIKNEITTDHKLDLTKPHITREQITKILGGIRPKKLENYRRALIHTSLGSTIRHEVDSGNKVCDYFLENKRSSSNERLEFLGDSVFNLIVGEYLFLKYPTKDEGFLTRLRTKIVRGTHCVKFSKIIGIGEFVLTGPIVKKCNNGEVGDRLLEDAFEAFLGAIYLDLGFDFVKEFVIRLIEKHVNFNVLHKDDNYKDLLMRYVQSKGVNLPEYTVLKQEGQPHNRVFVIQVSITIDDIVYDMGVGRGPNKKIAEQEAAKNAIKNIDSGDLGGIVGRDLK